jgi:DNA/RNA-binding domain of Phe-tRNA-synthetase-like protein
LRRPLVVTRGEDEILWVVGHRLSQQAAVTEETNNYLLINVTVPGELTQPAWNDEQAGDERL